MRTFNGTLLFSVSGLMKFTGCRHATSLDPDYINGAEIRPREDTDDAQLLQKLKWSLMTWPTSEKVVRNLS